MKKTRLLLILPIFLAFKVGAFFNTAHFSPFENTTNYNNMALWDGRYNWNPLFTGAQYSPENDARNMSRYGAQSQSFNNYQQHSTSQPSRPVAKNVQPSNWLIATDFSKTLDNLKNSGSKTFFVRELSTNFNQPYPHSAPIKSYQGVDNIYAKQTYDLSPAADSTSRVSY
jgi:hypothetical protein